MSWSRLQNITSFVMKLEIFKKFWELCIFFFSPEALLLTWLLLLLIFLSDLS